MIPQYVLDDLIRARDFYSNQNAETIANMEKGCTDCEVKSYTCLKRIITALEDKIEIDVYDAVAVKLYTQMMIIIGDYQIPSNNATIRFGYSDNTIDPSTFNYQFSKEVIMGSDQYEVEFPLEVLSADKHIAIEQPLSEPDKLYWFNTSFNKGNMGDFTMNPKIIIGDKEAYVSTNIFVFDGTNRKIILSTNEL